MTQSYDDHQLATPLRACQRCGHEYFMAAAICASCGPGWRMVQDVPAFVIRESRTDVNGNAMYGE